jgi:hypothetical protein
MLQYHLNYGNLPICLQTLVLHFMYECDSIDKLNDLAVFAFVNSRNLPVPYLWKKLIKTTHPRRAYFNWSKFLATDLNPYGLDIICLSGVRDTVRSLNWNYLRNLCITSSYIATKYTKKHLLVILQEDQKTFAIIFHLQRLLCCIDFPKACVRSRGAARFKYDRHIISNPNPLCMYIKPPMFYH